MMQTTWVEELNVFAAVWFDNIGQLGSRQSGVTREEAAFKLGLEMGRYPEEFTRPIGEYMPSYEAELKAQA